MEGRPSQEALLLTVYHFRGHDSLSLAVFNGIVLWGATDQTGTGYRVPLAFVFFHLKESWKKCKKELAWNGENSFES